MSTAMDDGRQESPGERTLSFRAITDESAAPPPTAAAESESAAPPPAAAAEEEAPASAGESPGESAELEASSAESAEPEVLSEEPAELEASSEEPADPEVSSDESAEPEVSSEESSDGPETSSDAGDAGDAGASDPEELEAWAELDESADEEPDVRAELEEPEAPSDEEPAESAEPAEPAELAESAEFTESAELAESAQLAGLDEPAEPAWLRELDEAEARAELAEQQARAALAETDKPVQPAGFLTLDDPEARVEPAETGESAEAGPEGSAAASKPSAWHFPDPQAERDLEAQAAEAARGEAADTGKPAGGRPPAPRVEPLPPQMVAALTAALNALRESVSDLRFGLDLPGAAEARQARADLLAQLQDYVLPRVRTNTAPALIVVAGSTGAGKSTLVNSLAEKNISRTGVRRPTTGIPVLVCHPDDQQWFTKGDLLGGLRRIDKPSPEAGRGSLVVVATEKLPQGVALLDTPDIDSVVEEHHEIAHRMLDAADLWIFVTTAARYADAPAWNLLRLAKERGARLAIVLSRVQPKAREVVLKHFVRMLTEYGLGEVDRFVIGEAKVVDGRLPDHEMTDLRLWLAELSVDEDRRAQAVHETLNGVLDSFRTRVPALARHLEGQVAFRTELRADVEAAYMSALAEIDKATRNGMLVHGEVLARWQDFAGSGDLMRTIQFRKRGRSSRQAPERVTAFRSALRAGLESLIVAAANRAAEEVVARWRHRSELGGTIGAGLERPSDELVRHATRAIAAWQEHVTELVRTEGVAKRSVSKFVSFDADSLSLIFMVAMFSGGTVEGVPHRLVNALLGAESLRGIGAKALSDLRARIGMLFDEESMRYVQALDSAGIPDESIATRLYQASYNLEVAR
ncbi:dynamin family protein [Nonomuraea sp. NPDC026600]|uniref:dynamin family protein n=1 Tax=Nonomuraea sp. NPDC026600 TaxID=3155363 RepID=UPI0033FBF656